MADIAASVLARLKIRLPKAEEGKEFTEKWSAADGGWM